MEAPNEHHMKPKTLKIIYSIIFIVAITIFFIGSFFISWLWIIALPVSFVMFSFFQATADHLVEYTFKCERCGTPNNFENDECSNCGLKFIGPEENKNQPIP